MRHLMMFIMICLLVGYAASPSRAAQPSSAADGDTTVVTGPVAFSNEQVIAEINAQRRKAGLAALAQNELLARAALLHSADMAARDYLAHDVPGGPTFVERVSTIGYPYREIAENAARGYATPQELVSAWMASPSHRATILNPAYRDIGIGLSVGQHRGQPTVSADALFGLQ